MLRVALAALHLLALGVGFGAVLRRATALAESPTPGSVRRALRADLDWGLAAGLWIVTGLWRYLAGVEKDTAYYNHNPAFLGKIGVLLLILALEIWPMLTLMRWRAAVAKGAPPESVAQPGAARRMSRISRWQALLIVVMVVLAVMMARGFGST